VADRVDVKNIAISVLDVVTVRDSLSTVVVKTVPASDYIGFDSVSYTKSYSPLFFTLFQRRVPVVYKSLSVLDVVAVKDSASVVPIKVVSVLDVVPVADRVDVKNIAIPVSDFIMYDSAVPVRYAVLSVFDIVSLPDSASVVARKVVSASDFIMYDYVPNMSPSDIIYKGLYSNPRTYGLSVSETGVVYDSAAVVKKTLDVLDKVIYDKADLYLL